MFQVVDIVEDAPDVLRVDTRQFGDEILNSRIILFRTHLRVSVRSQSLSLGRVRLRSTFL